MAEGATAHSAPSGCRLGRCRCRTYAVVSKPGLGEAEHDVTRHLSGSLQLVGTSARPEVARTWGMAFEGPKPVDTRIAAIAWDGAAATGERWSRDVPAREAAT